MTTPAPVAALMNLEQCDLTTVTAADAPGLLRSLKQLRGWADRFEADLTAHLNRLHSQGAGAPASDVHARNSGCSSREARTKDRRADLLDTATGFGDALADGAITAEHADALANATGRLDDALRSEVLEREAELLDRARTSSPEQFARACRNLIERIRRDHGIERNRRQRDNTYLRRSITPDGMYRINAELHPELGTAIFGALDAEIARLVAASGDRTLDRQQLAAEALGNLVSGGFQAQHPRKTEICVLVDLDTMLHGLHEASICEYTDGTALPVDTVRRLCCDADIIPITLTGDGVAVDQGRAQRRANRIQRRQLRAMYRTCAVEGCDVAFDRCEIHHLHQWEHGGPTDIHNLLPLCARHHHLFHDDHWHLHLAPDRTLTITQPDGTVFQESRPDIAPRTTSPPPRPGAPPTERGQASTLGSRGQTPLTDPARAQRRPPPTHRDPNTTDAQAALFT